MDVDRSGQHSEHVRDCLIWNYPDHPETRQSHHFEGFGHGGPSAEEGLRYSRHLHEEVQQVPPHQVNIQDNGYTHICVCGCGHGGGGGYSTASYVPWGGQAAPAVMAYEDPPVEQPSKPTIQETVPPAQHQAGPEGAKSKIRGVRWNKTSMLRNIHRAEQIEAKAKQNLWSMNRFGKSGPKLNTFQGIKGTPKKMLKHPHVPGHGYCPVHPDSTCTCQDCDHRPASCTCGKGAEGYGWHNEGFENTHGDRFPLDHKARKGSRSRANIPRADSVGHPPIKTTFAGSRTKAAPQRS